MMTEPKQEENGEAVKLSWPPTRKNLQVLYVEHRLSCAKIGRAYGRRPEEIRVRLQAAGIPRRDCAEHSRKVTDATIDRWIERYNNGESLAQIAGDTISPGTLLSRFRKRGLKLRSPGEARRMARKRRDASVLGEDSDELKRLYMDERLSCLKIARRHNLISQTDSAAAAIVYRRLKELGVGVRRGFIQRQYESVATDWAAMYAKGQSTTQIANGKVSPSTIIRYLDELGVKRRDSSQAHTKYQKRQFTGTELERAYLLGFTRGDVGVTRSYRLIVLATGSTHPAQLDLFTSLFAPYGPVNTYPTISKMVGFEWGISAALDSSFAFLLLQRHTDPSGVLGKEAWMSYLAGLFDAEGSLWIKGDRSFTPFWSLTNSDSRVLDWTMLYLGELGLHPFRERPTSEGVGRVWLCRREEVVALLRRLPIRHPEKKAKARIILDQRTKPWDKHVCWDRLRVEIKHDRHELIRAAERELSKRGRGALDGASGFMACLRYLSHWREFPLEQSIRLEVLNWLAEFVS